MNDLKWWTMVMVLVGVSAQGCVDTPGHQRFEDPLYAHPLVGAIGAVTVEMRTIGDEAFDRAYAVSPQYERRDDREVEVRVFEPRGEPAGIVAFAFANNDTHCSIVERYDTVGRSWASRGVVVAIPDSGDLNCKKGTRENIHYRAVDAIAAAEQARDWYGGELPVVFAGHSRGGGAALLAARRIPAVGAITLQGVDLVSYGWGRTMPDSPILGITASNDTDLDFPYTEPTEDRATGAYTWATVVGGIHAYTTDSLGLRKKDEPEVTREEQLAIVQMYGNAFIGERFDLPSVESPDDTLHAWVGASRLNSLANGPITSLRWRAPSDELLLIDDFNGPLREDDPPDENLLGGSNTTTGGLTAAEENAYKLEERVVGIYGDAQALVLRDRGVFWSEIPPEAVEAGEDEEGDDGDAIGEEYDGPVRVAFRVRCEDPCSFDLLVDLEDETREYESDQLKGFAHLGPQYVQIVSPEVSELPRRVGIRNAGPTVVVDDLRLERAP